MSKLFHIFYVWLISFLYFILFLDDVSLQIYENPSASEAMGIIDSLSKPTTYEKEVDLNKIKENLKESVIGMVDSIVCLEQAEMFKKLITPIPFTLSAITTKTSNNDFRKPASCINTPHNKKITPQRLFSTKKKKKS